LKTISIIQNLLFWYYTIL